VLRSRCYEAGDSASPIQDAKPGLRTHLPRHGQLLNRCGETVPGHEQSAEDALAAFDYLIEEDLIEYGCNGYEKVVEPLVDAIRAYLARQVRA
jgi:hypothetical protein